MADRNPHDVVRVATAQNPAEAHIVEQALKAEGIDCRVVGDYLDASFGDLPGLQPEIWVHQDDLAAAEEVLRRGQAVSDADTETESES